MWVRLMHRRHLNLGHIYLQQAVNKILPFLQDEIGHKHQPLPARSLALRLSHLLCDRAEQSDALEQNPILFIGCLDGFH